MGACFYVTVGSGYFVTSRIFLGKIFGSLGFFLYLCRVKEM